MLDIYLCLFKPNANVTISRGKPSPAEYVQYTPKAKRWKAYCGIDVGSISCGYAYSFRDTDHIWDNDNWTDQYCMYQCLCYLVNCMALMFIYCGISPLVQNSECAI